MVKRIFYLCFLPLLIGAFVYIFFGKAGLLGMSLHVVDITRFPFGGILIDTFPDFCWAFSLSNALHIFFYHVDVSFWKSTGFISVVTCGSELIQTILPQYFTFDLADLVIELFAVLLSSVYFHKIYESKSF
jgi:hypothetical protein